MKFWGKLIAYRLAGDHGLTAESITASLAEKTFKPAGKQDMYSVGWVPPAKHMPDQIAVVHQDAVMVMQRVETKLLPVAVIKMEADARIEKLEAEEKRKVGRREEREIRDRVAEELLPRAFSTLNHQRAIIDLKNNLVMVEAATSSKALQMLSSLRETLGGLPTRRIETKISPQCALTSWLAEGAPDGFTLDSDVELESPNPNGPIAKFSRMALEINEVRAHLAIGLMVNRIGASWAGKIGFQVSENLEFKKMAMLDILTKELDEQDNDCQAAEFDGGMAIFIGTMREFLPAMFEALGGEIADLFDASTEESAPAASIDTLPWSGSSTQDAMYDDAVAIVRKDRRASISSVQRNLRIGYNRAARIIEQMELNGIVSPMKSDGSREVLLLAA